MIKIAGYQGVSTVDYPGKLSFVMYTYGCPMRCPYCFNSALVDPCMEKDMTFLTKDDIYSVLDSRKDFVEAIVISGGEPTLHSGLIPFIRELRDRYPLAIKVDTSGINPGVLLKLMDGVDYIAMDVKTSFDKYSMFSPDVTAWRRILESMVFLNNNGRCDYEFRTTVWKGGFNLEDAVLVARFMSGGATYYLQNLVDNASPMLLPDKVGDERYTKKEVLAIAKELGDSGVTVKLRGFD